MAVNHEGPGSRSGSTAPVLVPLVIKRPSPDPDRAGRFADLALASLRCYKQCAGGLPPWR